MTKSMISIAAGILFVCAAGTAPDVRCATEKPSAGKRYDTFNIVYTGSIPYISLVDLAEKYHLPVSFDPLKLSMTVGRHDDTLTLTDKSHYVLFRGDVHTIFTPARLIRGAMYAPIPRILPLFSDLLPGGTLQWDVERRAVLVTGVTTTIRKVDYEHYSNGTMIHIRLTEPLEHSVELRNDNWLTIDLPRGSFAPDTLFAVNTSDLIADTNGFQYEGGAQISFRLSERVHDYSVQQTKASDEIMIALHRKRDTASTASIPSDTRIIPAEPIPNDQVWRIDTVVIDPGHGGKDSGAVGPNKTKEKNIVLQVALELKKIIDERGEIEAVLTRDSDVFVPLHERAKKAREAGGKLFLSIHANASPNRRARGAEVFFLSAARTKDAEEVARRENASIQYEENIDNYKHYASLFNGSNLPSNFRDIWVEMASNVYLKESQDMCSILLETSCAATKLDRRGVKQAGFYVMLGTQAFMPSVLFEIGFISNPEEEKLLKRASYQKRLATSMYDAIMTFKKRHERGLFSGR